MALKSTHSGVELSDLLASEIELDRLLVELSNRIAKAVESERSTIWLIDAESHELFSHVEHEPSEDVLRLKVGQGIVGRCIQTEEVLFITDVNLDSDWQAHVDEAFGFSTRNMCCVPIRNGDAQLIGALQVLNFGQRRNPPEVTEMAVAIAKDLTQIFQSTTLRPSASTSGVHVRGLFNKIVGQSTLMRSLYGLIRRASEVDATVLLHGETGTGKGLFARAIHVNSPRRHGPFVYLDCTTLPENLAESELFGHEKGAFTGASAAHRGKVEVAHEGTLFIDELGELPLPLQGKLLRFIQDREFERVGSSKTRSSDVRIIVATNRDLARMVREGRFRADLYYRIRILDIEMPPLRARGQAEIALLGTHFLEVFSEKFNRRGMSFSSLAERALCEHPWPGNIRELEHTIERAVILSRSQVIEPKVLGLLASDHEGKDREAGKNTGADVLGFGAFEDRTLREVVVGYASHMLKKNEGNQSATARLLGISRNRLTRILNQRVEIDDGRSET